MCGGVLGEIGNGIGNAWGGFRKDVNNALSNPYVDAAVTAVAAPELLGASGSLFAGADAVGASSALSDTAPILSESAAAPIDLTTGAPLSLTPDASALAGSQIGADATAPILSESAAAPIDLTTGAPLSLTPDASTFLPVTSGGAALSADMANALGIQQGLGASPAVAPTGVSPSVPDFGGTGMDPATVGPDSNWLDKLQALGGKAMTWAGNNPLSTAALGLTAKNLLTTPKLPSAAQTAFGASSAAVQQAEGILNSGGTSSPQWTTMKASIDSQIDQQLKTAMAQMQQTAANNGQGGANSAVVQQQMAALQQQATAQKEQLYSKALSDIVSQALTEMTGGDQTLGQIAQLQLGQSNNATQTASQTANLALQLARLNQPQSPAPAGG